MDKTIQPLYDILAECVKGIKRYLEIGVQEGDSLRIAIEHGDLEWITLCDTWGDTYGGTNRGGHGHINDILEEVGFDPGMCEFLDGDSKLLIPTLIPHTTPYDLILIDGDHSLLGCLTDMENCWQLLRPGGIMIVDDITHPRHTYLVHCVAAFAIEKSCVTRMTKQGHGVAILHKEDKCTS
jgi:hypothetical protein